MEMYVKLRRDPFYMPLTIMPAVQEGADVEFS